MIRSTTNPYGPGHNAVKFYFELPAKDFIIREREFSFENPLNGQIVKQLLTRLTVKGTIYENTILLEAQPNYIAQLKQSARNPAEEKAWLEGSWDIVAGGMFDDVWDARFNVVPRFEVPTSWRIDRAFDWGSSAPFSCGWWGESDGTDLVFPDGRKISTIRGDLFRLAEWYGWTGEPNEGLRMLNKEIAKGIKEREMKLWPNRKISAGPADNQITNFANGSSIAMDMQQPIKMDNGKIEMGINWLPSDKAAGSRKIGWEKMRQMIKNSPSR